MISLFAPMSSAITEFVAMGPAGGGASGATALEWVNVTYAPGVSSVSGVSIAPLTQTVPTLGAWQTLDPGGLVRRP
jgi:hypothetical protein